MKKFVVAILAALYLITSAGATLQLHYCMDKLVDWKLWSNGNKDDLCGSCGMTKTEATNNGCCKDYQTQIKLEDDHRAAESYQAIQLLPVIIPLEHFQLLFNYLPALTEEKPTSDAPPRNSGLSAYIRNHVFLI